VLFLYSKDSSLPIIIISFLTSSLTSLPGMLMQNSIYILTTLLHFSTLQLSSSVNQYASFSALLVHTITRQNFLMSMPPVDAVRLH
jgi:hypothetical protein